MKTNIFNKESDKRIYTSPVMECIKLDNEISLVLNSFNGLPGDPFATGCGVDNIEQQNTDSPWE